MNYDDDEGYPVIARSMDDLPDIDPKTRYLFSVLLTDILLGETTDEIL